MTLKIVALFNTTMLQYIFFLLGQSLHGINPKPIMTAPGHVSDKDLDLGLGKSIELELGTI